MKRIGCFFLIFALVLSLGSCGIRSNYITTRYLRIVEHEGLTYASSRFDCCVIDLDDRTFSICDDSSLDEEAFDSENAFKYEFFAGDYFGEMPDGYDGVAKHIQRCVLDNDSSIVDACGYVKDGALTGFVQVYGDSWGVYDCYSIEDIDHSIVFSYNAESDVFSVLHKIDDAVIVACSDDVIIYWRDRAYYAYDMKSCEEVYLVKDKAYDAGMIQQSVPIALFNEDMCILHLRKAGWYSEKTGSAYKEYMYVYDFGTNEFFELEWQY